MSKPIVVIVLAVALAAGVATYLSLSSTASGEASPKAAADVNPGGGHVRGNASAPVTLMEFGDYQCPSCGFYYPIVEEVLKRYPDKVKLEFHHYPLIQMHPHALAASKAVEAAGDQGKYWEMHDQVYQHQRQWSAVVDPQPLFLAYATEIGLDANKFMQSSKSLDVEKRVLEDIQRGSNAKVVGTPTFFINGRSVDPLPEGVDAFAKLIDAALPQMKQRATAISVVAFLGMVDALYLTLMRGVHVPCSVTGGCNDVLTSVYAEIYRVPLSAIGVAFYFTVFCMAVLAAFGTVSLMRWIFWLALPAFAITLVLLYLQAFVIHHFCQYCLASAAFVTTIFVLSAWPRPRTQIET